VTDFDEGPRFFKSSKIVTSCWPLVLICAVASTVVTLTSSRAAQGNLEVLPSWNGTGKIGYRAGLQWGITRVIKLGGGVAYLPDEVVIVDVTPSLRVGDPDSFWAELGAGPAWSTSKVIDGRDIDSNFMFHNEAVVGYKGLYVGFTHYSNLYIRSPNMGSNFVTLGVRIPLGNP
jgi:hypothetical protein